jgi:hypothetical protein
LKRGGHLCEPSSGLANVGFKQVSAFYERQLLADGCLSPTCFRVMLDWSFSEKLKSDRAENKESRHGTFFPAFNLNQTAEQDSVAVGRSAC